MNPPSILLIPVAKNVWDALESFGIPAYHLYPNTVEPSDGTPFCEIIQALRYDSHADVNLNDFALNFAIEQTTANESFATQYIYLMMLKLGETIRSYFKQYRLYVHDVLPYQYAYTDGVFLYLTLRDHPSPLPLKQDTCFAHA